MVLQKMVLTMNIGESIVNIVQYNPYALLMWDAHVCVIRITMKGPDRYLVKYIVKDEPTVSLYIVNQNEVKKYLETRIIGAPEAAVIQYADQMWELFTLTQTCQMTKYEFCDHRKIKLKKMKRLKRFMNQQ